MRCFKAVSPRLLLRLCSDIVTVPTLQERISDNAEELQHLVQHLAQRAVGAEAESLAERSSSGSAAIWPTTPGPEIFASSSSVCATC